MYTIRKTFKWEMAHRLMTSYTKACQEIHGHSYRAEIIISAEELNKDGMVIDFGELKNIVSPTIERWDHSLMLCSHDALTKNLQNYICVNFNPTAEKMCQCLCFEIFPLIKEKVPSITKLIVRIHETDTGWAEYSQEMK